MKKIDLFSHEGVQGLASRTATMEEISQAMGISTKTLYA
jgi:hypothetical protein